MSQRVSSPSLEIDTPDIFSLEVSAPRETHPGARHYTHVRAFHPITAKPVKDVNVTVELKLDINNKRKNVKRIGQHDAEGYALVHLNIPARIKDDEGELKIVAQHDGYVERNQFRSRSERQLADHGDDGQDHLSTRSTAARARAGV